MISPALSPSPPQHRYQLLLRPQAPEVSAAVGITKTAGIVSGAVRTKKIVDFAKDFGWMKIAFPQIALHNGVIALMTATAAARLVCAMMETNGIGNVNNKEHDDLVYASTRKSSQYTSCLLMATGATFRLQYQSSSRAQSDTAQG